MEIPEIEIPVLSYNPTKTKAPFWSRQVARRLLTSYLKDRRCIVGMEEAHSGLNPYAYGIGTILTYGVIDFGPSFDDIVQGNFRQQTIEDSQPKIAAVVPVRGDLQGIVSFDANDQGSLLGSKAKILPFLGEDLAVAYTDDDTFLGRVDFHDVRIAREAPINGFRLRHLLTQTDIDSAAF